MRTGEEITEFERFERSGWAERSASYDSGFGLMCAGVHRDILRAAGVARGTRLLEVGSGSGRLTAVAADIGADVAATDPVPQMVARTAAAVPGVPALAAALPALPFADGVFDTAVGAFVVNHVADPVAAVTELRRVVRRGGRIALSIWDDDARNRTLGVISEAVAEVGAALSGPGEHYPMRDYSDPVTFPALLREGGLDEIVARRCTWTHTAGADEWWHAVLGGTVRTAALFERLDTGTAEAIRAVYDRNVAPYQGEDGLRLPASALIASGVR